MIGQLTTPKAPALIDWSLAVRNLLRNRRRSLSTLLALAIGLAAILLFSGFKSNLTQTGLTLYAQAGGHLQVQHRDYFNYGSGNPSGYGLPNYVALIDAIRNDAVLKPMLAVVTPILRFGGLAGNFDAGISRTVIGTGYVPEDVNRMRRWNEFAVPAARPRFALEGTAPDTAIVGAGLARVLQLCALLKPEDCPTPATGDPGRSAGAALPDDVAALTLLESPIASATSSRPGSRIEVLSASTHGAPNVAALTVAAAENQGFKELDESTLILHLAQAQRLVFGRDTPRATALMLLLNKSADEAAAAARLQQVVSTVQRQKDPPVVIRRFDELNPFYVQSEQLFDVIFGFIFVLIGGIVLFTVGNTMNTAVAERTVEIGTLRAIGARRGVIRRLFVVEGFVLGCAGAALGLVAAVALAALVNASGVSWLPPGSSERMALQIRVLADSRVVIGSTVALVLIATASAWLPAWRAAHMSMVDALRHA